MSLRKNLSVVLITYNEAELLPGCLKSVSWADEIIVLDSGSTDETRKIATLAGANVFQSSDWPGFGIQRQRAQAHASSDYILMIDADERVSPLLRREIQETLSKKIHQRAIYGFHRCNFFLDRFIRHSGWYPDRVIRLYSRKHYQYNSLAVHESLDTKNSDVVLLTGKLQHLTCRDLTAFQLKQLRYAKTWAKEQYNQGSQSSMFSIIIHTFVAFLKSWLQCAGFLDGKRGLLLAIVKSQYTFNKYAILWALNNTEKKNI